MTKLKIITTSWDDGHVLDIKLSRLLKKYKIRGTFYVSPKHNELKENLLSKEQIVNLSDDFEIGAHTIKHDILTQLDETGVYKSLVESKQYTESLIKKEIKVFCYPRGEYNEKIKFIVKKTGFLGARTVKSFITDYPKDFFAFGTTIHVYPSKNIISNINECVRNNIKFIPFMFSTDWKKIAEDTFNHVNKFGGIWHLWGH